MTATSDFEIFLVATPGFEQTLLEEARARGFKGPKQVPGGVQMHGNWPDVWRANLQLRGASRVLARLGSFRVVHLSQLDKRAHKFPWADTLLPDIPVRVDVTCKKSKIYHQKAAAQRLERAITDTVGAPIDADAEVCIKARIFNDVCTISLDSSGEGLHKRGHKEALNKAPLRETLAALLLRECGFDGQEPVFDPMCGSGTFIMEAAEIATGLWPGRSRSFAFEQLETFDPEKWQELKNKQTTHETEFSFYGRDRDAGAIERAQANAKRADISQLCHFEKQPISLIRVPEEPTGLVIVNPPYGVRIGEVKKLMPLYQKMGHVLKERFGGWRVGLATTSDQLAKATALPFEDKALTFSHGGLKVKLFKTGPLS